jgi:Amt family ammonium transporter
MQSIRPLFCSTPLLTILLLFLSGSSLFAEEAASELDSGDTAWMLTSTVLVLLMTLPGLALFYGGLVRSKNLLSVLMHCFAVACLASVMWVGFLYSLAFKGVCPWVGDFSAAFLRGVTADSVEGTIPETVFVMFQMTFAIITPGLIIGAFVERIKFSAVMLFSALWLILVYAPAVHWVWAGSGWMYNNGTIDLAGGIVVHATAGVSALVLAKMLGPRSGFPNKLMPPHSPGLVMMGAALLWVGWFGFNAGSQLAAGGSAGMTMLVTHISAATASLTWMVVEKIKTGKPGLVGIVTGMVAGLASITPASGNVGPMGAMIIGLAAGIVCYFACDFIKSRLGIDDSLDVFAVHGVGGIMGTLLVAFLGTEAFGGMGINKGSSLAQFGTQALGLLVTIVWSGVATALIILLCKKTIGFRVSTEDEETGLDIAEHGEQSYAL